MSTNFDANSEFAPDWLQMGRHGGILFPSGMVLHSTDLPRLVFDKRSFTCFHLIQANFEANPQKFCQSLPIQGKFRQIFQITCRSAQIHSNGSLLHYIFVQLSQNFCPLTVPYKLPACRVCTNLVYQHQRYPIKTSVAFVWLFCFKSHKIYCHQ